MPGLLRWDWDQFKSVLEDDPGAQGLPQLSDLSRHHPARSAPPFLGAPETFRTCDLCPSHLNSFPNQSCQLSGHRMNPRCGVILILSMGTEVVIFALGEPTYLV